MKTGCFRLVPSFLFPISFLFLFFFCLACQTPSMYSEAELFFRKVQNNQVLNLDNVDYHKALSYQENGWNTLFWAVYHKNSELSIALLNMSQKKDLYDGFHDMNILFFAVQYFHPPIITALERFPQLWEEKWGEVQMTLLMWAAQNAAGDFLSAYSRVKNSWEELDNQGRNVLFYLSRYLNTTEWIRTYQIIFEKEPSLSFLSPYQEKENNNLLLHAAEYANTSLLEFFLDLGFDINVTNAQKENALIIALKKENTATSILLMEKGIFLNQTDAHGDSPLKLSIFLKNYLVFYRLIQETSLDWSILDQEGNNINDWIDQTQDKNLKTWLSSK